MVKYDLSHLTQNDNQDVWGPIQDDEALFLYSIIRASRLKRIFEIGGLNGYSAQNFLKAVNFASDSVVYTCDINPVPKLATNHNVIQKNVLDVTPQDVQNQPLDLVFFDCHEEVQLEMFNSFVSKGIITDDTILTLHDTNLHYAPYNRWGPFVPEENGFAHQVVERKMVNYFKELGYDIFSIKTDSSKHSPEFPIRHGISICQKFRKML
jgi:predicted O-methyltransferase YrrM